MDPHEASSVPYAQPWFFYNAKYSLEDPFAPMPPAESSANNMDDETLSTSANIDITSKKSDLRFSNGNQTRGSNTPRGQTQVGDDESPDNVAEEENMNDEPNLALLADLTVRWTKNRPLSWPNFSKWHAFSTTDVQNLEDKFQFLIRSELEKSSSLDDTNGRIFCDFIRSQFLNPIESESEKDDPDPLQWPVPVGLTRLYGMHFPSLCLKPLYWAPLSDQARAIRSTWFYTSTMTPVEPENAVELERAYRELRPWTKAYEEEIHAAIQIGSNAEDKLKGILNPDSALSFLDSDLTRMSAKSSTENVAGSTPAEGSTSTPQNSTPSSFMKKEVIFSSSEEGIGYILSPSLISSTAQSLSFLTGGAAKPTKLLPALLKGEVVKICGGVEVQRGFDWKKYAQIHKIPIEGEDEASEKHQVERRPSTLIMVVHGIGQKLAQKRSAFSFTYAVNNLRLLMAHQLHDDPNIEQHITPKSSIMLLPVNWRSGLKFDDGLVEGQSNNEFNPFSLEDISIEGIPAVRNLVGDVMLDIPYYLSHHRSKILSAVVSECNRIYRLWCRYNPEFQNYGKVNIIAHSLGSAIAVDILSNQPNVPPPLYSQCEVEDPAKAVLEFDTKKIIFAGSPVGFFMLLHRSNFIPRLGRRKTMFNEEDPKFKLCSGELGLYGCLAVDDIYNVAHVYDPIAYRTNPAVDAEYAKQLRPAFIPSGSNFSLMPSTDTTFSMATSKAWDVFAIPTSLRWNKGESKSLNNESAVKSNEGETFTTEDGQMIDTLPAEMELETHDFLRETKAETVMSLLNENGQLDYLLQSSGGMLDNQYLSMLSAHSSYWQSKEFARLILVECSRQEGPDHCLLALKASKKQGIGI